MHLIELDPDRDAAALHAVFGDDASCRYLPRPAQPDVAATRALLRQWHEGWEDTDWAIRDGDVTVGRVSLYRTRDGVWEAACMVTPAARGRGLAFQALTVAIDDVFQRKAAHRIEGDIDPDNQPSIRLFERLGFRLEGHLRQAWLTHLGRRDALIYGLLREDPRPGRVEGGEVERSAGSAATDASQLVRRVGPRCSDRGSRLALLVTGGAHAGDGRRGDPSRAKSSATVDGAALLSYHGDMGDTNALLCSALLCSAPVSSSERHRSPGRGRD